MTKRGKFRGCGCGCGQGTWSTYAPGHDAKHVARLVRNTIESWGHEDLDTATAWRYAIQQLSTQALQAKFRRSMRIRAAKHLGSIIRQMENSNWQRQSHLANMIGRFDSYYADSGIESQYTLAEVAAAMGMSYHSVNQRNS